MSSPQMVRSETTPAAARVDLKLEVVVLPVADVERSKRFYEGLGWRVDGDFTNGPEWRAVQMTPPGSPCSIHFGKGITTAEPGSIRNLYLAVSSIEAARTELIGLGADVSEPFHFTASSTKGCAARSWLPGKRRASLASRPTAASYST